MDVLHIIKNKSREPTLTWTIRDDAPNCFTKDALNFNTFIRAFTHNNLEWQWLERKVCYYFLIDDGNVRLCEKQPDILTSDQKLKQYVGKVWRYCYDVMHNIGKI